mgnify:CR=1 FL=1
MKAYNTIYEGGTDEIVEKKSRFIAQVFPVETEEEVATILEQMKKKYWDARHNCYAFVLGETSQISRCSDDGEPSGTAGRPILEVINGKELTNILIVVTRYFGGTLLGTGGLVRAYSQSAQAGIMASKVIRKEVGYRVSIDTMQNNIAILDTQYTVKVQMILLVPIEQTESLLKEVTEATAGQSVWSQEKEPVHFAVIDKEVVVF